ncbi:MAG TPA: response regulator [Pyrinomonadaceae bacterium]|jgi:DNA-binding response OmpR family regulator
MPTARVLCVEDDADTRELLKLLLGYSDFEAVVAPDADAALRLMRGERFSLYVLDGGLRGARGLSLCEQIRASDDRTPIIIFSGDAAPADIKAGMFAGANAYLVKPDSSELVPTIRRLLQSSRGEESRPALPNQLTLAQNY